MGLYVVKDVKHHVFYEAHFRLGPRAAAVSKPLLDEGNEMSETYTHMNWCPDTFEEFRLAALVGVVILIVLAYIIGYSQGYKAGKEEGRPSQQPPGTDRSVEPTVSKVFCCFNAGAEGST